ncbi:MAG: 4Fe-4S dicluster domain-containing protein [Helicobacteraceae bacterium]|jgi:Fe-S-cluster-containing hydrogenase component 2|nr:4Fe-4S dicluster domain-containing protein [Helicobacteraceae bacterium]
MRDFNDRVNKIRTNYFWINPKKCKACWKCAELCPEKVIGRVGFLWHKHIIIANGDSCTGCKRCVKICPAGVFSESMPDEIKAFVQNFRMRQRGESGKAADSA